MHNMEPGSVFNMFSSLNKINILLNILHDTYIT